MAPTATGIWRGVTDSEYFVHDDSSVRVEEVDDNDGQGHWHEVDMRHDDHGAASSHEGTQVFCLEDDEEEPTVEAVGSSMKSSVTQLGF